MKEKSHHIKLILSVFLVTFAVVFFIVASNTSALAVQPMVAAGYGYTVGLKSEGTVVAVGLNNFLQLNVSSWTDIKQLAAGGFHTVGLKTGGKLKISSMNLPIASYREFAT